MSENNYDKYVQEKMGVDMDNPAEVKCAIENSYLAFCVLCLPQHFYLKPGAFHHKLKDVLTDDDEEALAIIGFRGSAKSTHCSFAFPIWGAITEKYHFEILINDTGTQRELNMLNIKTEIEENQQIKECYPGLHSRTGKWTKGELLLSNGVFILGRSRGQKVRGLKFKQYRPDLIIGDDLEDLEWVKKKENRDKTERWFLGEVVPAQEETKAKMIVIGNMLHTNALMARLKKKQIYTTLEFPLMDKDKNIAWTGKYPNMAAIEKQKAKVNKTTWLREYLLKIVAEDGAVIVEEDLHYYKTEILTKLDDNGKLILDIEDSGVGNDLAISEKQTADFTTFVSGLKVSMRGSKILIKPNPTRKRMDFDATQKEALRIQEVMPYGTKFYVEDVGYQKAALQNMKKAGVSVYPMRPITDKRARLETVAPFIKDGTVLFPEIGCEDLIEELVGFGVEEHDDLVDALVYLILGLTRRRKKVPTSGNPSAI
ncbi:MAG: phage terminase large subunit [Candidatus Omnitrophica bacterium]|nr:phage terminase large subunit [Candidatus Omnitrophota bacterium]